MSETHRNLILRKELSGESFLKLHLLSPEEGVQLCLKRISSKNSSSKPKPDLFDTAEVQLDTSRHGTARFVSDYQLIQRRSEIGQSYHSLRYASDFCNLLILNGSHIADLPGLYQLAERSLDAFAERSAPSIVFLKSLYLLLKDEGYPVRESWWPELPASTRSEARLLLQQPVPETVTSDQREQCDEAIRHLLNWLRRGTDIILPPGII